MHGAMAHHLTRPPSYRAQEPGHRPEAWVETVEELFCRPPSWNWNPEAPPSVARSAEALSYPRPHPLPARSRREALLWTSETLRWARDGPQ